MFILDNLTLGSNQTAQALLADGTSATLTFIYRAAVQRWTVDVSYPATGFVCKGKGLSTHPNLLRLWRNIIPFGLQISTPDDTDPFMPSDLAIAAGGAPPRVTVVVLDQTGGNTDVTDVETQYFSAGAVPAY